MIGIFDSGIGGVTVLKEILKHNPNYHYVYYSDSKNNPYGDKNKDEIKKIVFDVVKYLIDKGCKVIIIACNTASAVCVNDLRNTYTNITFIAIEPAYKMVHDYNPNGKTLVMATRGTIESEKFQKLYNKYDNHNTILYPCLGLEELIEKNDEIGIKKYLEDNIYQFKSVDNVVLGCTHYPLIKEQIREILKDVTFFDGSMGISYELKRKLKELNINEENNKIEFFDSAQSNLKKQRFFEILYNKK